MADALDDARQGPVLAALDTFAADPTLANRNALTAAYNLARSPQFYTDGTRLALYKNGWHPVAECTSPAIATVLRDRLNLDIAGGWNPTA